MLLNPCLRQYPTVSTNSKKRHSKHHKNQIDMERVPPVNKLRLTKTVETCPPNLVEYQNILGYQTYYSTFNQLLYIVFDHNENLYYIFENEGSDDIENSLGWCIRTFIIKS